MHRALFFLLCACGRIGFDAPGGASGDNQSGDDAGGAGDDGGGAGDDGGGAGSNTKDMCVGTVTPSTTFPNEGNACTDWGAIQATMNGMITETGGELVISPQNNTPGGSVSCTRTNVTMTGAGVFTEVGAVLAGAMVQTRLELVWSGETYFIGVTNGVIHSGTLASDAAGGAYDNAAMRWWRMFLDAGKIHWQYSADGHAWNELGALNATPTGLATLRVIGREPVATAGLGSARFESVNVCPP